MYSKGTGSSNLPLSAINFEPTGNSGFFVFGMSFIPVDTVQGYIWSSSHSRYRSYLTTHRGILYFRILVLNHLQSQIGKREIRRSLNGLDSRTARTKALRLSLAAQHFFALADDLAHERIHSAQEKMLNYLVLQKKISNPWVHFYSIPHWKKTCLPLL